MVYGKLWFTMFQSGMFQTYQAPPGFEYKPDFITPEEEILLLEEFAKVPLKPYEYKGYDSKREIKSFTRRFGYPPFLIPFLKRTAEFAKVKLENIRHALITRYDAGTAIGWHRDQPPFEKVIGISLGSSAHFRFRKRAWKEKKPVWEHATVTASPRSIYIMAGASRYEWQHSIPAVPSLRYSLTIRTIEK